MQKHTDAKWTRTGSRIVAGGRGVIAACPSPAEGGVVEIMANLQLIAAAPDLLAALRQLVADWDAVPEMAQVPDEINENRHWAAARAAIRSASVLH